MNAVKELDQYFEDLEAKDQFSGIVLVTQGTSRIYTGCYGYASRAWKVRNNLETRFDTASVTKLFTAVAALQLIESGQLAFDTRAVEFLGLEDTTISPEANVFHFLTHSSGIGDDADEEAGESYEDLWKIKPNYSITRTADFLPQFVDKPANFPPGQGCRYNNCGFILLGLMLEKATGQTYRDYIRKHVFARAGMTHSDFLRLDRVNENTAEGCDPIQDESGCIVDWKRNIYSYPPVGSPDSGAYVTAVDLDRFLRAVMAGKLLSSEHTRAFFTPQVPYRSGEKYDSMNGYGIWFYLDKAGKIICCQKEGINAGVSAYIRHFLDKDVNVVMLSNMEDGVWEPVWKVHDMVVAGQLGE